jgi:hypothetical protein
LTTLTGIVRDKKTQAPVASVLVTAMFPQSPGERSAVTDGEGSYTIPDIPAGDFTLRFENGGFQPVTRGGVALGGNQVLRFDVELLPVPFRSDGGSG